MPISSAPGLAFFVFVFLPMATRDRRSRVVGVCEIPGRMAGIMANQNQEGYCPVLATWTDVTDQPFRPLPSSPTVLLFSAHWV